MNEILEIVKFIINILVIISFTLYFIEDYKYKKRLKEFKKRLEESDKDDNNI